MTTPKSTPTFNFPHPELTPIRGQPNSTTLKVLKSEIYANCRAIPSTYGGGLHGHLGLALPAAEYLALAGVAFNLPAHPGPTPTIVAAGAKPTGAEITKATQIYTAALLSLSTARALMGALTAQITRAVDKVYLAALRDKVYGFSDVTLVQMLTHLVTKYAIITRAELEANRLQLSHAWNVDDPIETLWTRVIEICSLATDGKEPLTDATTIELLTIMLEKTGLFTSACEAWHRKPEADQTWDNFQVHFTAENKQRLRKLTTGQAGFHGANAADGGTPPVVLHTAFAAAATTPATPRRAPTAVPPATPVVTTNDGTRMYYCWTHGLGTNANHTSATCQRPGEGHKQNATAINVQGGNNTIMAGRPRGPNASAPAAAN